MRLSQFIVQNMEPILLQWESFAGSLLPAATDMTQLQLRDHAQEILEAIIKDMSAPQTEDEQVEKSKGLIFKLPGAPETAAETHGMLRAHHGFEIKQMVSEYRALRASVLKLWLADLQTTPANMDDVMRFNEAIDQALAESIDFYCQKVEERRNLFLAMLGHDLRTPVQVIQMTAILLQRISAGEKVAAAARRLIDHGTRMSALLGQLIQINKSNMSLGIKIAPAPQNMALLLGEELDQIQCAYPDTQLDLQVSGPTNGVWDGEGVRRVMGNLVVNAIKFSEASAPISVRIAGYADQITFEVRNKGTPVNSKSVDDLFEPFKNAMSKEIHSDGSFGLGLFIANQLVTAHGGIIRARCEEGETVFAVQLPWIST